MPLGKGKAIFPFLIALIYGILIVSVPWEELRGVPYPDIENYEVRYAAVKNYGLSYFKIDSGVLNYLSAEYLWYFLLASSSLSGLDFDLFVTLCSFSAAFISTFCVSFTSRLGVRTSHQPYFDRPLFFAASQRTGIRTSAICHFFSS